MQGYNELMCSENGGKGSICGVILAGGKSRRMGREKALLRIQGLPLAARLAQLLASVTDEIVISCSGNGAALESLGYPVIQDLFPGQGPLAGLHAAIHHTQRPLVLLLACDLPCLHADLLRGLIDASAGFDAVVPQTAGGRFIRSARFTGAPAQNPPKSDCVAEKTK